MATKRCPNYTKKKLRKMTASPTTDSFEDGPLSEDPTEKSETPSTSREDVLIELLQSVKANMGEMSESLERLHKANSAED